MPETGGKRHGPPVTARELLLGLAFGCNASWVHMTFKSMNLFSGEGLGESMLDLAYLLSIAVLVVVLAAVAMAGRRIEKPLLSPAALVVLPLGMTLSTALIPLAGALGGAPGTALIATAGVLTGFFSAPYLVRIGCTFARLTTHSTIVASAIGTIAASFAFTLFVLFGQLESTVLAMSMPIVSACLLELGSRSLAEEDSGAKIREADRSLEEEPSVSAEWGRLLAKLSACSFLAGFANELARTFYAQICFIDAGEAVYSIAQAGSALIVTLVVVLLTLVFASIKAEESAAKNCYYLVLLLLIGGVVLLPLPFVYPGMDTAFTANIPYAVNSASYWSFGMLMWSVLCCLAGRTRIMRVRTIAAVRSAWAAGPLFGMLLARWVMGCWGITLQTTFPAMLLAVLAIVLACTFALSERDLMTVMEIIPLARKRRFHEKCRRVIEKYGLTEREGEVLTMLAKGRNVPYIREELCISRSTASTHRQHIYEKLGVHSQQELIDLVQNS